MSWQHKIYYHLKGHIVVIVDRRMNEIKNIRPVIFLDGHQETTPFFRSFQNT